MKALLQRATTGWALLGGVLVIAIVLVTAANVGAFMADRIASSFGSNVRALPGYEDFVRLAVSVAALTFIPYCQMRKGHIAVDLFVQAMPKVLQGLLDRLWLALTAALGAFLCYWMWVGMLETRSDNTLTPILGWPEWPWYGPGIISMALWCAVALGQLLEGRRHG